MQRVTMTREELYEVVWSQPTVRLAAAYGLSDVGLAKLCRRYNIPRPPRGYWAKLQAGQTPRRTPLPARDGPTEIVLHPPPQKPAHVSGAGREPTADETPPEAKIVVAANLRGAHALVAASPCRGTRSAGRCGCATRC